MKHRSKQAAAGLMAVILALCVLSGCGGTAPSGAPDDAKLKIVTTIFPVYDWTREILGDQADHAELSMLLDTGVDLHSFQPTAADIMRISTCDLFIYVGGESDFWVDDALQEATNKDMVVIDLMDALGDRAKEEEIVEGMQAEEEEEEEESEEGPEYDEHIWLSLQNAETLCGVIETALEEIDPEHAEDYKTNAGAYINELSALDEGFESAVSGGATDTLLFGDRFPFRYMTDDYDLNYYAAFVGCSAETEASFETILFLANKVDELGLTHVMTIEGTDHRIAETIIQNTQTKGQQILALDSMQSVTAKDVEAGVTYLSLMEKNLDVLAQALS